MAYLSLYSNHPKFSYLIQKNPNSPMVLKGNRKGTLFGWFPPDQKDRSYHVYFRDGEDEISYPRDENQEFEHLDLNRFSSPRFVLDVISEMLASAFKKPLPDDQDGVAAHQIEIKGFGCRAKTIESFAKNFPGYTVQFQNVGPETSGIYNVQISTEYALQKLLAFVSCLAVISTLQREHFDTHSAAEKYMHALTTIDAPYLIRYLFKIHFLKETKLFNEFRDVLNTSSRYQFDFIHGFNADARMRWVSQEIGQESERAIVDLGCGEGRYVGLLKKKLRFPYYGIDPDAECQKRTTDKIERCEVQGKVFDSFETFCAQHDGSDVDVLMMEMIEHQESVEAAQALLDAVLEKPFVKRILLTTPNKEFNQFYDFEADETRHDDHAFELTGEEFRQYCNRVLEGSRLQAPLEYLIGGLGDTVNGIQPQQRVVFTKPGQG